MTFEDGMLAAQLLMEEKYGRAIRGEQRRVEREEDDTFAASKAALRAHQQQLARQ